MSHLMRATFSFLDTKVRFARDSLHLRGFQKYHPQRPGHRPTNKGEPKKVILAESKAIAARRCLIHILPILTSISILTMNLHGLYIGIDFPGPLKSDTITLMFLQLAAKAHEIMIVASLGIIVLQTVRHELLFGDGLPLGLVGSGLSFSNFEFFFRREFYGALRYLATHQNRTRQVGFVALLLVSGLTAVLAGPASAVLLVPRSQTYPLGATDIYLDGSHDQFWPSDMSTHFSELQRYCGPENSTLYAVCPAGGYDSLRQHWRSVNYTNFLDQSVRSYAKELAGSRFYWPVSSPHSQVPPMHIVGNPRSTDKTQQPYTWLIQAHAASTVLLDRLAVDWWKVALSHMGGNSARIDDRHIQARSQSVISAVRCANPRNISMQDNTMTFPTITGRWDWAEDADLVVDSLDIDTSSSMRFQWIHLPERFGPASIGALFQASIGSDNQSRVVVGCTAQSGWVPSDLITDSYTFWSGWYPWGIDFGARSPSWNAASTSPTNGRIVLSDDWLNLLTPQLVTNSSDTISSTMSTIEDILKTSGLATVDDGITLTDDWINDDSQPDGDKIRFLEAIVSSVLADGISRSGSHQLFDIPGPDPDWSLSMYRPRMDFNHRILRGQNAFEAPTSPETEFVTIHAEMEISGFSYRATLASYLSMVVLLTHMLMASAHIIWVSFHKQTSRSWTSVAELIALSQNSQPAIQALANTGGGITKSKSFAAMAKIRVRQQPNDPERDHVELIFEDDGDYDHSSIPEPSAQNGVKAKNLNVISLSQKPRNNWTFPLPRDRSTLPDEVELGGLSISRELLIPKPQPAKITRAEDTVQVNKAYG